MFGWFLSTSEMNVSMSDRLDESVMRSCFPFKQSRSTMEETGFLVSLRFYHPNHHVCLADF